MSGHSRFEFVRGQLERAAISPGWPRFIFEFAVFVFKQGWACLFGALMLAALLGTHFWWPSNAPLHRYDALTLFAIAVQAAMLGFRLETPREASVILIFHAVGTVMELFKTSAGSWAYHERPSEIGEVPLFAVSCFPRSEHIAELWRGLISDSVLYPKAHRTGCRDLLNFFAHHWLVVSAGTVAILLLLWEAVWCRRSMATLDAAASRFSGRMFSGSRKHGTWPMLNLPVRGGCTCAPGEVGAGIAVSLVRAGHLGRRSRKTDDVVERMPAAAAHSLARSSRA